MNQLKKVRNILFEKASHFMRFLILASSEYMYALPTLTEFKKKFEVSVRNMLICTKMIPELIRSTGCAEVEEQN